MHFKLWFGNGLSHYQKTNVLDSLESKEYAYYKLNIDQITKFVYEVL